ncbi:hydroxymethylglutaryl-CoA lyase [Limimaricola pyoseonensis]|uniref:Hydroxymethylglutaryl-CoA lyase n=1 Tax=Limimaricola pyoseonensis TaxID=521013 RepID=A0A1G7IAX2_9RHOB|nr:hydroxymethylglutaryl-CoA lyase [Limimaricola pyoseonensis]SDF09718.1 hydroxymethylglutaryl-CoA lyase [Limimaricola pyoseonensis]
MTERVEIVEVGPRDGLQNESKVIPAAAKIELVDRLSACGFRRIEVTSFVNPKRVPQMADAAEVLAGIARNPNIRYAALTPNLRGFEAARDARAEEVAVFGSASEGFSQANIGCSIAESMERFLPVMEAAQGAGLPVRGYVSCVTHCPYDGKVEPEAVADVAARLLEMGCYEISLGETLGRALPEDTDAMLDAVLQRVPSEKLAGHFHDTSGRALDNVAVCLDRGLRVFDASIGGLGGCPFAPGAAGNVATEGLALMLQERGFDTGLDMKRLAETAGFAKELRA